MGGVACNGAFGWAQDTVGLAFGVGKPSAAGVDAQFTFEFYSRMQITKRLSLTPDIQIIANPSSNPERDLLAVLGLRA